MKKQFLSCLLAVSALTCTASPVQSQSINLFDWAFHIDGSVRESSQGVPMPVDGALDSSGLGTLTWKTKTAGSHTFIGFFDFEIDETQNGFDNEFGLTINSPETRQSWEIDEPGWRFGDIYSHLKSGILDNQNAIPQGKDEDVSFALGWKFDLATGGDATVMLSISDIMPQAGFYLKQTDQESGVSVFFSGKLETTDATNSLVPEPATLILFSTGLVGLCGLRKRGKNS